MPNKGCRTWPHTSRPQADGAKGHSGDGTTLIGHAGLSNRWDASIPSIGQARDLRLKECQNHEKSVVNTNPNSSFEREESVCSQELTESILLEMVS
jgi:hypothetical protein